MKRWAHARGVMTVDEKGEWLRREALIWELEPFLEMLEQWRRGGSLDAIRKELNHDHMAALDRVLKEQ